jgi:hypothetical protein
MNFEFFPEIIFQQKIWLLFCCFSEKQYIFRQKKNGKWKSKIGNWRTTSNIMIGVMERYIYTSGVM